MRIRTSIETPRAITPKTAAEINDLAAKGFGVNSSQEMAPDTERHIASSDYIQQARHNGELVGFALYTRQLWRASN